MTEHTFDQQAWLDRIDYGGPLDPTLGTLDQLIFAHSHAISYESLDIMLGRTPRLDLDSLQRKMISGGRGGYCLEQNMLFREGLRSLGYKITSLQGRVVRGMAIDAPRPAIHMLLQVDLPEGPYLADVGFGNLAPTSALKNEAEFRSVFRDEFGLNMSDDEVRTCISVMERKGEKGAPHPFFA
jgi:N-hydroxyarylamine O-acetyltransferase